MKVSELACRMNELEQKSALPRGGGTFEHKSWGGQVADTDEVAAFAADLQPKRALSIEMKAVTSAAASGGVLSRPERDNLLLQPTRELRIRDLISVIPVSVGSVEYPRMKTRATGAGMVAEGDMKPQSDMAFDLATVPIRKIAHWVLASAEVLADSPQLSGIIDTELVFGLDELEDRQLLKGDGIGQNLPGIVPQASAFVDPLGLTTPNQIDVLGAALLQADLTDVPADGVVLHPADWTRMRLLKNADGEYLLGAPGSDVPPRLFGRPVVATKAQTQGEFLVGAFRAGATIYDRMLSTVLISTEDSDNFRRNLLTILAEKRLGLAVKLPSAFIAGAFPV